MAEYSESFKRAIEFVLSQEGGWADNPKDPGGATFKGVTLKLFRAWRNNPNVSKQDLQQASIDEIFALYHQLFWKQVQGDSLPPGVGLMAFDAAVNSGVPNAGLALQRAVNTFGVHKLAEDGIVGHKTAAAVGNIDLHKLVAEFASRRMVFYGALQTFSMFGFGWARRLMLAVQIATALVEVGKQVVSAVEAAKAADQPAAPALPAAEGPTT